MENKKLSEIIKELTNQISLKEISTRDFVEEMKALYDKVESVEINLEHTKNLVKDEKCHDKKN